MTDARAHLRSRLLNVACCLAVATAGCARRGLELPTGTGTPLPDASAFYAAITKPCTGVRTLTAELALSGRVAEQKLRGRALAGFASPGSMRLEGLAPFGAPGFILVARSGDATLLLPRDDRVLRGAAPEQILGALTGVSLRPADLLAILTGCVVPAPHAASGTEHGSEWRIVELDGGGTVYLRRARAGWQVRAAERDGWRIEYPPWDGAFPRSVRIIGKSPAVDVTAAISQLETNTPIDAAAFEVDVPRDALPITIDELREAGPLRAGSGRDATRPSSAGSSGPPRGPDTADKR